MFVLSFSLRSRIDTGARDFSAISLHAVSLLSQKSIGPASLGSLHRHLTFAYLEVGILSSAMHCAPAPGYIRGRRTASRHRPTTIFTDTATRNDNNGSRAAPVAGIQPADLSFSRIGTPFVSKGFSLWFLVYDSFAKSEVACRFCVGLRRCFYESFDDPSLTFFGSFQRNFLRCIVNRRMQRGKILPVFNGSQSDKIREDSILDPPVADYLQA